MKELFVKLKLKRRTSVSTGGLNCVLQGFDNDSDFDKIRMMIHDSKKGNVNNNDSILK